MPKTLSWEVGALGYERKKSYSKIYTVLPKDRRKIAYDPEKAEVIISATSGRLLIITVL